MTTELDTSYKGTFYVGGKKPREAYEQEIEFYKFRAEAIEQVLAALPDLPPDTHAFISRERGDAWRKVDRCKELLQEKYGQP